MSKLNILWINDNPITAEYMVFMYANNAKRRKWFDEVSITIWGASALLAAENKDIQNCIKEGMALGIEFYACISCADAINASDALEELGVDVKSMGVPLTAMIKSEDEHFITL